MTETHVATSVSPAEPETATTRSSPFQPGRCRDHPTIDLVTHAAAGLRWYGPANAIVCPDPHHRPGPPERCRWCGGPLVAPGTPTWETNERREYCTSNHRLQAFRARARATS